MSILNKVTLAGMRKSPARTIVTIVGIVLSTAMIAGVATFGASLQNYLVESSLAKTGNWHVQFTNVDAAGIDALTADPEVTHLSTIDEVGYAALPGIRSEDKPYVFIAGLTEGAVDTLPISVLSGRLPERSDEIIVPSHLAAKGGVRLQVGDQVPLAVGERHLADVTLSQNDPYSAGKEGENPEQFTPTMQRIYTVVGTMERPEFETQTAPGYTILTKADAGTTPTLSTAFVTVESPANAGSWAEQSGIGSSYVLNEDVLRFLGGSGSATFNLILYTLVGIVILIIMIGSVFLIYNSFSISTSERTKQFGILSSVGATPQQLRNSVIFEGLCLAALGIPIGLIIGTGGIAAVLPVIEKNMGTLAENSVPLTLSISIPALIAAAFVSLVTILVSAYVPARKAAIRPVMESLRETNEVLITSEKVRTSSFAARLLGLEGALAMKNFKRNRRRYRTIVLSLVLSVVLFAAGTAFGSTLKRLADLITMDFDYDVLFVADNLPALEADQTFDTLMSAFGVTDGSSQTVLDYTVEVGPETLSPEYRSELGGTEMAETVTLPFHFQFIADDQYAAFAAEQGVDTEHHTGSLPEMVAVAKAQMPTSDTDGTNQNTSLVDLFGGAAEPLTITPIAPDGVPVGTPAEISVRFVDTYPVDPPPGKGTLPAPTNVEGATSPYVFIVIAPSSMEDAFTVSGVGETVAMAFQSSTPSETTKQMEALIQSLGISSDYQLHNVYSMVEQFESVTFVVEVFTYGFVLLITLIAVANVFNTISTNIKLRKRELAMLRSVGMSDAQLNRMMGLESVFYGARTLVIGIPLTILVTWLIHSGLATVESVEGFDFVFPWASIAISTAGVLLIVSLTMGFSIRKLKKENIINALRSDNL
ncbi:putative ABC transport system permease protein [Salana multivorans]|uniref:Putative ABC transport system permease protein n=1 Tax=Salana multivorans TaxID=120377 RepID=A0A3N2D812_9MICO|nr:ABC transporter permease [Salana multivorans]ROR95919.1 putative ABC transport system permease protein [Salana multivorans]